MFKQGRGKSNDSVQESLREDKSVWNKEVSVFISNLIDLKKIMNGWPSKFHQQKSVIKEPIPADPATILGVLSSDFQDLAQKGKNIVQKQLDYSKTRKQKQENKSASLYSNLSISDLEFKYGSNPFSRFLTKIKNPPIGFGEKSNLRRLRAELLNNCAQSFKILNKFQAKVVESSDQSILESKDLLQTAWDAFNISYLSFRHFKENLKKQDNIEKDLVNTDIINKYKTPENVDNIKDKEVSKQDSKVEEKISSSTLDKIKDFSNNKRFFSNLDVSRHLIDLNSYVEKFIIKNKKELDPNFNTAYDNCIDFIKMELNIEGSSFEDLVKNLINKKSPELEKKSQDFLKKWIGKTNHQLNLFDNTSGIRLSCFEDAKNLRIKLNNLMDSLESDLNFESLDLEFRDINNDFMKIRRLVESLNRFMKLKK